MDNARLLAQALGWHVEKFNWKSDDPNLPQMSGYGWNVISPDGIVIDNNASSEEHAWNIAIRRGGDWFNNLSAAMALCCEIAKKRDWWVAIQPSLKKLDGSPEYVVSAYMLDMNWQQNGHFEEAYLNSEYDADGDENAADPVADALARLAYKALSVQK